MKARSQGSGFSHRARRAAAFAALLLIIVQGSLRAGEPASRISILDEIWAELSKHDPFFDRESPKVRAIHTEARERLAGMTDENERLRELVRVLSHLGDGHTSLQSRWFLPDKPPPPLPVAGANELYRARLNGYAFRRDIYVHIAFPEEATAEKPTVAEDCRVVSVDGAVVNHRAGWALLNGAKDTEVIVELERTDGRGIVRRYPRVEPVEARTHYGPTSRQSVPDPHTGKQRARVVEVVVTSRRLDDNVGYIRIHHLVTQQVVADFHAALDALMDTDGLILDLRDCRGGYPWIMMPITGRFFTKYEKVCSFDGRSPLIGMLVRSVGKVGIAPFGKPYTKPLVVLINDGTASMAEGMSFSLGDTGRGVLVGRPTMGLNAAIRNVTLSNGLVLWHSWIRVNRMNGQHYQGVGVEPQERVELTEGEARKAGASAAKVERERQLEHAKRRVREMIAGQRSADRARE